MQPSLWGPHLWKSIHYIALGYPDNPDPELRTTYKDFYVNLWRVVPCLKCAINYRRHLTELPPIDEFLGSKEDLFKWTVALHNLVNVELGKPQMDFKTASAMYSTGIHLTAPSQLTAPAPAPSPSAPHHEQVIKIVEKSVGSFLPHNVAIVTLSIIICLLLAFMISQKKHVGK